MEVQLLGRVAVWHGGREVALARSHRRCVLAVLAMAPGRPVPPEILIDRVWGDRPPRQVIHSLYTHVSAVRRVLDELRDDTGGAALRRLDAGYTLAIDPDRIDLHRARRLAGKVVPLDGDGASGDRSAADLLRDACSLWRGTPLAGLTSDWAARTRAALVQEWLALVTDRYTVELRLGGHASAVGPLGALVADHPLVEPLAGLLMHALYRCGRQAEALAVYARTRQRLVDELGDDPGTGLRQLHEQILRHDPTLDLAPDRAMTTTAAPTVRVPPPPAQLPADAAVFTGRTGQLAYLDALLSDAREAAEARRATAVISAIDGMAGVGKSALVVHWAHRVRECFPDGQLYVNLHGHATRPPLPAIEPLVRFLRAFGVPAEQVPIEAEEAAALYRSLLADKAVLVVLDNAANPDQVRPLLPTGPGSVVLVTSRDQLDGLVVREGAHRLRLDVLAPDEADALLSRTVGLQRTQAEPAAVAELARLCGYLPLALRIAAANLAARPQQPIRTYLRRLLDSDRVGALVVPGDPQSAVPAAFDMSYTRLPSPAQRMFRLLALVPGPDVTADGAAALAGITPTRAARLLEGLASAHLVEEHKLGRYTWHDLLRSYAADRAQHEDTDRVRDAARRRLYDFYLHSIDAAARLLYPEKVRLPTTARRPSSVDLRDHAHALAWLDEELPCLVAAVRHAESCGPRQVAWRLADGLRGYFWLRRSTVDWLTVSEAALAAAEAENDLSGQAAALISLADAHLDRGGHALAAETYRRALQVGQELGSPHVQSVSLNNLGEVHRRTGRPHDAADCYTQALALSQRSGSDLGEAMELGNLGSVHRALGQLQRAADYHAEALAIHRRIGSQPTEAVELRELGETYHAMGRFDQALSLLADALSLHQKVGDRAGEAETRRCLSAVYRDAGNPSLELARAALSIAREVGSPEVEADALLSLGTVHQQLAEHRQALDHHLEAMRMAERVDLGRCRAEALIGIATAHQNLGNHNEAYRHLEQAVTLTGELDLRILEGQALTALAALCLADGLADRSSDLAERALGIHSATGHRLGEAHTHLVLGQVQRHTGHAAAAYAHGRRAHALFAAVGAPEPAELAPLLTA